MQVEDTNWKNEYMYKHVTKLLKSKPKVADDQYVLYKPFFYWMGHKKIDCRNYYS